MSPQSCLKLLNNLSVSQLAELSKLSKSYISQVKHGKCPPSQKLLESLFHFWIQHTKTQTNYLAQFLQSRQASEASSGSLLFYRVKLSRFLNDLNADTATSRDIEEFLLQFHNPGNRHAYYRVIKTFYNWREETFNVPNPMKKVKAPRLAKLILPSLTVEQVSTLLDRVDKVRDKAIIALFTDGGLRLSELTNIKLQDIDWETRTIRVIGKSRKEALAPFGKLSERYLREWLSQYVPVGNVWGLNQWGIISMFRRLRASTGLPCNPHTFRRTFATLLRKSGLDVMTIKDLGRWESLEMVQRYTRSVSFRDCLKFYRAPLS
ncbi:MAG: tyrosine-type recombinase/integrase [Chloroflexi bacterium]|nr:tyrosine-type recombinase/integrase [Chloroflexota bacterium]